ncbi:MAG: type B 50S ribosomal protein L31 [Parachlamydiales bacterium]|jgi:large subunit ribosomal protein L31
MKKDKHPQYQEVVFVDSSTNRQFKCGAAISSKETIELDGQTYPMIRISISSDSHPLFTGDRNRFVDAEGRVKKFQRRYAEASEKRQKGSEKE